MSIFKDAQEGSLDEFRLDYYIRNNSTILNAQDPDSGLTPLATAVVGGFPEEVKQLLKKGAKADGLSKDGETPLLLAAWKTTNERPLIIQLLLEKTPRSSVDTTCAVAENKTPLMFAIEAKDVDSVRMLRKAGASLSIKNDSGFIVKEVAEDVGNSAILRALNPDKEKADLERLAMIVVSVLLYVVSWVNAAFNGIVRLASGLNPAPDQRIDQSVNRGREPETKEEFVKNVDEYVNDNDGVLDEFFKDKKDFIQDVARKVTELEQDQTTVLGEKDVLPKTIKVSLHQQVIYCDDSDSMHRDSRWDDQKNLVKRIAKITTRILPEGEGVALRFINQNVDNSSNLTLQGIGQIMDSMSWQKNGNTEIGTYLRIKILEPMVYSKIKAGNLERPLLISIITDGMPNVESNSELVKAILECGNELQKAGLSRKSVKFMIGHIGKPRPGRADKAKEFLEILKSNEDIKPVAFVTTDKLDAKFDKFHANERDLDRWLIETLFEPLNKKDQ